MKFRPRTRPLADLIDACLGPALQAQGFAASDIIVAWPEIVGSRLSDVCQPLRLEWPRRSRLHAEARPEPATLVIRVEGAFALELQHLAPLVLERVNTHYGWRCVGRIVLKQGPVRRAPARQVPQPALAETDRRRLEEATAAIAEDKLRTALGRLGRAVVGSKRTKA